MQRMNYDVIRHFETFRKRMIVVKEERKTELKAVQAAKARRNRIHRRRKRTAILAVEVILLVLLLGTAFCMVKQGKLQKVNIEMSAK